MLAALVVAVLPSCANAADLSQPLSGLSFLVGEWDAGKGVVADTGSASTGHSSFTVESDGALLLRRDRTDLFDKSGKPSGSFHQVMTIYADNGTLHADYIDPQHVIHYDRVAVEPGRSATFTSVAQSGAPQFRLTYLKTDPSTLSVTFAMAMPGSSDFRPVASGTIAKAP
jgi:hypothetical protein